MKARTAIIALLLLVLGLVTQTVSAQAGCPGLTILKDSNKQLDEQGICTAAQPLVGKGLQVFVFVTDRNPQTEDNWWAIRDEVEIGWGIYNPSNDTFSKNAFTVELTTNTSHPWGHDIAFGEALFGTPLDTDTAINRIEGKLKNDVAAGDMSAAIATALTESYSVAFPPPTSVPMSPAPVIIQEGSRTEVQVDTEPVMRGIGRFLLLVFVLGVGGAGIFFIVIPGVKIYGRMSQLRRQIKTIQKRVASLLNSAEGLLQGSAIDEILLYQLWSSYGGQLHNPHDHQVRSMLTESRQVVNRALEVYSDLAKAKMPLKTSALERLVRSWEVLYLTVVGRSETILSMTGTEQEALLDPLLVIEREEVDSALVAQIDQVLRENESAGLRIGLMVLEADEVEEAGILGYIDQVKQLLHQLREAKEQAPVLLQQAKELRQQVADQTGTPEELGDTNPFEFPDNLIAETQEAMQGQRWLEVVELAEQAVAALSRLPEVLSEFAQALQSRDQNLAVLTEIIQQGYRLPAKTEAANKETKYDVSKVVKAIKSGDYPKALEFSREIVTDSQHGLHHMQALVALRNKNRDELERLSEEVARVDRYRQKTVQSAWQALRAYPRSNWEAISSYYDEAQEAIQALFDEPSEPSDLASRIESHNSMHDQAFGQAEQLLTEAFAQLAAAEHQLTEIVTQLAEVQSIEQSVTEALASAEAEVTKARARRDKDDNWVDAEVDSQISKAEEILASARNYAKSREFIQANIKIQHARQLASQAYNSADQQAQTIAGLYRELENSRTSAERAVTSALQAQSYLVPAAQKASTAGMCNQAKNKLHAARQTETTVHGEDRELKRALSEAIQAYTAAIEMANSASHQVDADKKEYQGWVSKANSAISSAESAISTAQRYTRDSDAGGAGQHALGRAASALPSSPQDGESVDSLRRKSDAAEEAARYAQQAQQEAQSRIAEAEAAREAERRRREEEERRRRQEEQRRRDEAQRQRLSSSSMGFSSRRSSSTFGSSSRGSSSMGSSRRR